MSGTSQRPTGSRVLTTRGGVIVSKQRQHNKHQAALPVTAYLSLFPCQKPLLLCGSFLGSILGRGKRDEELRVIESYVLSASPTFHPRCNQQVSLQKNTPNCYISFNAKATFSITRACCLVLFCVSERIVAAPVLVWHYAKRMFSPFTNQYQTSFHPQIIPFHKKRPKLIQFFFRQALCNRLCN